MHLTTKLDVNNKYDCFIVRELTNVKVFPCWMKWMKKKIIIIIRSIVFQNIGLLFFESFANYLPANLLKDFDV